MTVCSYHVTYAFHSESTVYVALLEQARYLKVKWLQQDLNSQALSMLTNTEPFGETDQMIELSYEYLSLGCIGLYVLLMSRTRFRVNPHSIFVRISKYPFAQNRRNIWSLSDFNGTQTNISLVRKWTLNSLLKVTKLLSWLVSTYLYGPYDCMFLSRYVRVSGWIHTLCLPECLGTLFLKQAQYLKFKWLQRDSNPEPLTS